MSNVAAIHGGGVYDQASEPDKWEIVVTNAPNNLGNYEARAYRNGAEALGSFSYSENRDEAITACRRFVEWYKSRDTTTETIPL